jgi:hypothetical protein
MEALGGSDDMQHVGGQLAIHPATFWTREIPQVVRCDETAGGY